MSRYGDGGTDVVGVDVPGDRAPLIRRICHGIHSLVAAATARPTGTPRSLAGCVVAIVAAGLAGGCSGPLSSLDPAGPFAESVARLWWIMLVGAGAIFALVGGLAAYALWRADRSIAVNENLWVIGGGVVFSSVVLAALLVYALATGERLLVRDDVGGLTVDVVARQFMFEFRYPERADAEPSPVLVIPAGRPVDVRVTSEDVIHSFWVPRLAGKIDAIPGQVNIIRIRADEPGIYHGHCSEYCGVGHATMQFRVEAVSEADFARFLAGEAMGRRRTAVEERSQ